MVGKNCTIGKNCILDHAYIFDNVTIMDNCVLRHCVVGRGSKICAGVTISDGAAIGGGVVIDANIKISKYFIQNTLPEDSRNNFFFQTPILSMKSFFQMKIIPLNWAAKPIRFPMKKKK